VRVAKLIIVGMLFVSLAFPANAFAAVPRYSTTYSKSQIIKVATGQVKGMYRYDYHHYSSYQTSCLVKLAYRESSWRNWATNGSCWGLFQLSSGMKTWKWYVPNWNTDRAIHYIIGRYGTPSRALAHSYRYGWY
jgi:hypothetical protein